MFVDTPAEHVFTSVEDSNTVTVKMTCTVGM